MKNPHNCFNDLKKKKVLVIGDIMVDAYDFCYSSASRPSPEKEGTKVYLASKTTQVLGGAGNVAANLASLGVQTTLIGLCGDDGRSIDVKKMCSDIGIMPQLIIDESRVTTLKTRIYIDDNYHMRRDIENRHKVSEQISRKVIDIVDDVVSHFDAVILSDYDKGLFTEKNAPKLIRKCNNNLPVIVDFKPSNSHYFKGATVVSPNLSEASTLIPKFSVINSQIYIKKLYELLGAENVMVTLGAEGLIIYDGDDSFRIDGVSVPAIDPCGCGDTVRACLTVGLISGLSLKEAGDFANYAASKVVQKLGTNTLRLDEINNWKIS
jgi:D-beta-D-heptose 7-phosphate kinase/D-beta-D-heptose 1-phosphate adenosyltransferase